MLKQHQKALPLCKNGERIIDVIPSVLTLARTSEATTRDETGRYFTTVSFTTLFKTLTQSATDRILICALMQRLGLIIYIGRSGRRNMYFLASEAWCNEVLIEATLTAVYNEYLIHRATLRELSTVRKIHTVQHSSEYGSSSLKLIDEVAALVVERDEAQAALTKTTATITQLETQLATVYSQTKISVADELADAIAKLRKK